MSRNVIQKLKIGAHRGYVFSYLNKFFFGDGSKAPGFCQVSPPMWIDPHDAGTGGIDRREIAAHDSTPDSLGVPMMGPSPLIHADNPIDDGKLRLQGADNIQDRTIYTRMMKDIFRPPVIDPGHDPE